MELLIYFPITLVVILGGLWLGGVFSKADDYDPYNPDRQ